MNIDLKKVFGPIITHYDKLLAVGGAIILLASVVLLGIRAAVASRQQAEFVRKVMSIPPDFPTVKAFSRESYDRGMHRFHNPTMMEWSETGENMFLVPEQRATCPECRKPVDYSSTNCVFCFAGIEEGTLKEADRDGDGMPDIWEEKYGLNKADPDDAAMDLDKDGYTNLEEYKTVRSNIPSTEPNNALSFPPAWMFNKLVVGVTTSLQFNLVFMSAMRQSSNEFTFAVNHVEGRTYWVKLNQEVLSFRVMKYEEKFEDDPSIPGRKKDVSTLSLASGDRKVVLKKGERQKQWEKSAVVRYVPDSQDVQVAEGKEFEVRGQKYSVKSIDAQSDRVVISDPTLDRDNIVLDPTGTSESAALPTSAGDDGNATGGD